jgi:CNT family concentrative nucleoside transporter
MSFESVFRGLIGIAVILSLAFIFSSQRKSISKRTVFMGLGVQILLALAVLKLAPVQWLFEFVGKIFVKILDFTRDGSVFLLGDLMNVKSYGFIFAFQVLPTIIFFSALSSVLFYLGVIQVVVKMLARIFVRLLNVSGAESLSVAGNIFLGQTEAPLMIKEYLPKMNRSEVFLVMVGGMATVAGGVLSAYISFLGGDDPVQRLLFAKHLLAASVMAAPGAIVIAKILVPQTQSISTDPQISDQKLGANFLDALSIGTTDGLKLAVNVGAMLLVFFAFIALVNFVFLKAGDFSGINGWVATFSENRYSALSLQFILGYLFAPLMWILGVPWQDVLSAGQLLGEKLVASEFVAYTSLASMKAYGVITSQKAIIMSTYMLCGFANFASIGIQVGGIGSLAPNQRLLLSQFGFKAVLGGTLASLLSAAIVGMLI